MKKEKVFLQGLEIDVWSLNTVVVGTGAAGWNAADSLVNLGQLDVAIVTEGVNMGTSRNTGSDKQTYYKLTLAGDEKDSIVEMAKTLFEGGSRHGDIALVEAALSARCFYKLVEIGVDFPHSRYGEYIGYKTDHDPRQRATSIGPLTSRAMTEKLERQARLKGITIFDNMLVIGILTTEDLRAVGLVALDMDRLQQDSRGLTLFNCTNIIYATGGPAGIYEASVYPVSQTGSMGVAFEAGVKGVNLTESQYGIASTQFRWNLSGSYQQVIPRYISTDQDGNNAIEFLDAYFSNVGAMLTAIFMKGYQWPFDPRKIANYGSSLIDLLVYNEINNKGRRVFLDYRSNPTCALKDGEFDFSLLGAEALRYLEKSDVLFGSPIERLQKMNLPAIELYRNNGIDLSAELLEIAVCAQHSNGGLQGDIWWESNISHFFPVGEVNGSFGVYRPGGSALNSTQVGSLRAAQYIAQNYRQEPLGVDEFLRLIQSQAERKLTVARKLAASAVLPHSLLNKIQTLRQRMTSSGAHVRNLASIEAAISECYSELKAFPDSVGLLSPLDLPDAFRYYDMLITQLLYLSAIREYIQKGGQSRGSYLISESAGDLPTAGLADSFRYRLADQALMQYVCEASVNTEDDWRCSFVWTPVRPIPEEEYWFETLWAAYRAGDIWEKEE